MLKAFTISDVGIELVYPDNTTEEFKLESPNGDNPFEFGFRQIPILENYDGGEFDERRGNHIYQLVVNYEYTSHEMDLRKLLVAKAIHLKFPPFFTNILNYQEAEVLLDNGTAVKNYLGGFPFANFLGDAMPSGGVGLNFVGVEPLTEAQVMQFKWATSFHVTADTVVNIFFDSSGSMNDTLAPLTDMRDNLLKDALIEFYNGDDELYDEKVTVQNFADERTFNVLQTGSTAGVPVINIVFQDEADPNYHGIEFDSGVRTETYEGDITAFRTALNSFNQFRGFVFHVASESAWQEAFRAFLIGVDNGVNAYAPPFGTSDRSQPNYILDVNNGDTPQYYLDLILNALRTA